jgi:hypothetical protein
MVVIATYVSVWDNGDDNTVIDHNSAPSTQPGLWCQWTPNEDGTEIEWDGGEKFYSYIEWIVYLINKVLIPNGYVLNGIVDWRGEDFNDNGSIEITDNVVVADGVTYKPKKEEVVMLLDVPVDKKKKKHSGIRILNVIECKSGSYSVQSFLITNEETEDKLVKDAEALYRKLARQYGAPTGLKRFEEEVGYDTYEIQNYSVALSWSDEVTTIEE